MSGDLSLGPLLSRMNPEDVQLLMEAAVSGEAARMLCLVGCAPDGLGAEEIDRHQQLVGTLATLADLPVDSQARCMVGSLHGESAVRERHDPP